MSKKPVIIVLLLVVLALGVSIFLMPHLGEIALMQKKDKHFEEALAAYEQQKATGKLTLEMANEMSQLYLQKGEVDKAISIMEAFVAEHPDHLEARKRLGTYYQYAQRNDDYLHNLEEINRLTPTPENLKTLSDMYNFNGNYEKQAQTLQQLVQSEQGKEPKHFLDLANILATKKDYAGAANTLLQLKQTQPQNFGFEETALLASIELDQNKPDDALMVASEWQGAHAGESQQVARLVNILNFKGSPELANKLLSKYSDEQINASSDLLQEKILIELALGQDDDAFARLKMLEADGKLNAPELKERLLYLALTHDDRPLADKVLAEMDLKALNEAQLAALVELGMTRNDEALLKRMQNDFPESDAAAHPVLSALLALGLHEPSANTRLAELEKLDIGVPSILQVSRTCARAAHKDCAVAFLHKLPDAKDLNDADLASAVDIYFDLKAWHDGKTLLDAAGDRNSRELAEARVKFAAATGDEAVVETWLNENGETANPRLLADLFFLSYNNQHLALATVIAERFHAREDSALSRSCLAEVYVKTGQYKQALALLRDENKRTPDDESNYLFALAKLAPANPEYRKELGDYAAKRLRSDMPRQQKLSLIYALIAAHEIEPALPYIRELALKEGGEWASLYAEYLDKHGKHDEARSFWVAVASQPHTLVKEQRSIAYNLLANGYKDDAEAIFFRLAQHEPANGADVQSLLYVWGPRPSADKLEWIADRMQRSSGAEHERWAQILANTVDDNTMLALAAKSPLNLRSPALTTRYVQALSRQNKFSEQYPMIEEMAHEQDRTDLLKLYAEAARDGGDYPDAMKAYALLTQMNGHDVVSLRNAGTFAYSHANYTASKQYLGQYVATSADAQAADPKAADAYFTYAEDFRQDGDMKNAQKYYLLAQQQMAANPSNDAESLSHQAQILVWTGHPKEGLSAFAQAQKTYPNDDALRADYAGTLMDLGRYKPAAQLLMTPPSAAGDAQSTVAAAVTLSSIQHYTLASGDTELTVFLNNQTKDLQQTTQSLQGLPGVSSVDEGYGQLLAVAEPGTHFKVEQNAQGLSVSTVSESLSGSALEARQMALRYDLLSARNELETGHVYAAAQRIKELRAQDPNDAQVIGFSANAENYGGNWPRAQTLLAEGEKIAPENEDIKKLDDDIKRINAPGVKLDYEWLRNGNDTDQITTLSGYGYATDNVQLGMSVQDHHMEARNDRFSDGRVGNANVWRQNADIYGTYAWEGGNYLQASLYANNDTLGAGGYWHFLTPLGESLVTGEYHRPYFEYPELVVDEGTRDRIGFLQTYKPMPRLTISGGPSYNRYNTKDTDDVFSSAEANFDVVYRLIDAQPTLAVAYGFDGEYELGQKKGFDDTASFTPLTPLRTREVHFVSLDGGYNFTSTTYAEMLVGYGYDRFGGHGPEIAGSINHELGDNFDAQLRASYGFESGTGSENVSMAGGYLRWKY